MLIASAGIKARLARTLNSFCRLIHAYLILRDSLAATDTKRTRLVLSQFCGYTAYARTLQLSSAGILAPNGPSCRAEPRGTAGLSTFCPGRAPRASPVLAGSRYGLFHHLPRHAAVYHCRTHAAAARYAQRRAAAFPSSLGFAPSRRNMVASGRLVPRHQRILALAGR